jgi:hypothetical protein
VNKTSIVKIELEKGHSWTPDSILIKTAKFIWRRPGLVEGGDTDGCDRVA